MRLDFWRIGNKSKHWWWQISLQYLMLTFHLGPVQIMQGRVRHVSDDHPCLFWMEAWINCRSPINQSQIEWRVELSELWMLQMMLARPCLDTRLLIPQKTSPPLVPALVSPSLHLSRCLGLATQIQKNTIFFLEFILYWQNGHNRLFHRGPRSDNKWEIHTKN